MATTAPTRIVSLDLIRGIAVMGIFSVNIVGMAMIESAYFYPPLYGFDALGDRIMWAANFVLVDGRFRALFSILFGASMVLVCERADAGGGSAARVHYPRMIVLLAFGLAHYFLLWWGDILANYALVGMVAFAFWRLPVRALLSIAVALLALYYLPQVAFGAQELARLPQSAAGMPLTPELAELKAAHSSIAAHLTYTLGTDPWRPLNSVFAYGIETLGFMLLGMAGYRCGFLGGSWRRRRYVQVALACVAASLAYHLTAAWLIFQSSFEPITFMVWNRYLSGPLHPIGAAGYAALIILLFGRGGPLADRVAAVGRTAFSNYLGATLIGVVLFFGFGLGLYGEVSRGEAWLFVPPVWALMLLWSKSWLDRFRYGPFEWAWRCLARWRWEPMRRRAQPSTRLP